MFKEDVFALKDFEQNTKIKNYYILKAKVINYKKFN